MDDEVDFQTFSELKLDEYFAQYLTDPASVQILTAIQDVARNLDQRKKVKFDFSIFDRALSSVNRPRPKPPSAVPSLTKLPRIDSKPTLLKDKDVVVKKPTAVPQIDPFYGPKISSKEEKAIEQIAKHDKIPSEKLAPFIQSFCRLPKCFASILTRSKGLSNGEKIVQFWRKFLLGRDNNERFFNIIVNNVNTINSKNNNSIFASDSDAMIYPKDLIPYVKKIVDTHPSLAFLKDQDVFKNKFIEFIVARCFYIMDPELRGVVGLQQFRKVDLATIFYRAERMPDVNDTQHVFNYHHFYVAFCKFWDLDNDQDGYISKDELYKFNGSTISPIVIDRFFKSKSYPRYDPSIPTYNKADQKNAKGDMGRTNRKKHIDFIAFTYFLMSSEDKTNLTSINFWYKLCDLDDDGVLSIQEVEELYKTQYERMRITGNETIPFNDIFRQLIDMVQPADPSFITVSDLMRSQMANYFFNTLFDLQKFLVHEYQFPEENDDIEDELSKKLTPWEVYVVVEYDQLVNENT